MIAENRQSEALIADWRKIPIEYSAEKVERQRIVGQNMLMCRFRFAPFVGTVEHTHPHE